MGDGDVTAAMNVSGERLRAAAEPRHVFGGLWVDHETRPRPTIHVAVTRRSDAIEDVVRRLVDEAIAVRLHDATYTEQHLRAVAERVSAWFAAHRDVRWSMVGVSVVSNAVSVCFPPSSSPAHREAFRAAFPDADVHVGFAEFWQD